MISPAAVAPRYNTYMLLMWLLYTFWKMQHMCCRGTHMWLWLAMLQVWHNVQDSSTQTRFMQHSWFIAQTYLNNVHPMVLVLGCISSYTFLLLPPVSLSWCSCLSMVVVSRGQPVFCRFCFAITASLASWTVPTSAEGREKEGSSFPLPPRLRRLLGTV